MKYIFNNHSVDVNRLMETEVSYSLSRDYGYVINKCEDNSLNDFIKDMSVMSNNKNKIYGIVNCRMKNSNSKGLAKRVQVNVDYTSMRGRLYVFYMDLDGIVDFDSFISLEPKMKEVLDNVNYFYRLSKSGKGMHLFIPVMCDYKEVHQIRFAINKINNILKFIAIPINNMLSKGLVDYVNDLVVEDKHKIKSLNKLISFAKNNNVNSKFFIDTKVFSLGRILFNSPHEPIFVFNRPDFVNLKDFKDLLAVKFELETGKGYIDKFDKDDSDLLINLDVEHSEDNKKSKNKNIKYVYGVAREIANVLLRETNLENASKKEKELLMIKSRYDANIKSKPIFNKKGEVIGNYRYTKKINDEDILFLSKNVLDIEKLSKKEREELKEQSYSKLKNYIRYNRTKELRNDFGSYYTGLMNILLHLGIPFKLYGNYMLMSLSPKEKSFGDVYHYFSLYDLWFFQSPNSLRHFDSSVCIDKYVFKKGNDLAIKGKFLPILLYQMFKNYGYNFTLDDCIYLTIGLGFGLRLLSHHRIEILFSIIEAFNYALQEGLNEIPIGKFININCSQTIINFFDNFIDFIVELSDGLFKWEGSGIRTTVLKITDLNAWNTFLNLDNKKKEISKLVDNFCNNFNQLKGKDEYSYFLTVYNKFYGSEFDYEDDFCKFRLVDLFYTNYLCDNLRGVNEKVLRVLYMLGFFFFRQFELLNYYGDFEEDYKKMLASCPLLLVLYRLYGYGEYGRLRYEIFRETKHLKNNMVSKDYWFMVNHIYRKSMERNYFTFN